MAGLAGDLIENLWGIEIEKQEDLTKGMDRVVEVLVGQTGETIGDTAEPPIDSLMGKDLAGRAEAAALKEMEEDTAEIVAATGELGKEIGETATDNLGELAADQAGMGEAEGLEGDRFF